MEELICICCPIGCHLSVDATDMSNIIVTGNNCPRGKKYAIDEMTCPKRMVTSIVKVVGGNIPMVSVKTSEAIEKSKIFDCLQELKNIEVQAPIKIGDIVLKGVCGSDINVVATKNIEKI